MTRATLPPPLAEEIEEAILLGNVAALDAVLAHVYDTEDFPEELRAGLEALRHFRAHYGPEGIAPPQDALEKKKTMLMESAWGAELLEMMRQKNYKVAHIA